MDAEDGVQLLGPEKGGGSAVVRSRQSKLEHYSWVCLWAEIKSVLCVKARWGRGSSC